MEMKNINLPLIALRGMTVLPDMVIHFDRKGNGKRPENLSGNTG